jgi:hypothetical protein
MAAESFQPQIQVTLFKNIGMSSAGAGTAASQRYTGAQRQISLTPFLSEISSISIEKSIRSCYGTFSITIADQMIAQGGGGLGGAVQGDTLARLVQPFDVIEIRATRKPQSSAGQPLPLLMRGYVRAISRHERMGDDGRPQRLVTIQGGDAGVLLDICRSNVMPGAPGSQDIQDEFTFYSTWFQGAGNSVGASQFVAGCITGILNPMVSVMQAAAELTSGSATVGSNSSFAPSPVRPLTPVTLVQNGTVYLTGIDARWNGNNLYGLMAQYGNVGLGLNELFTQTMGTAGQEQDYLIFRPIPYVDPGGGYILAPYTDSSGTAAAGYPQTITVTDRELVELSTQRDDSRVLNFVYVLPQWLIAGGETSVIQNAWATLTGNNVITDENSAQALYGFRPIFLADEEGPRVDGQSADQYQSDVNTALTELKQKIDDLKSINADNIVFESGSMVIRGRPDIQVGNYVKLIRGVQSNGGQTVGAFTEQMYVTAVSHEVLPFRTWTTGLQFERGTGFVTAVEDGQSPYLREMTGGVMGVYS